MKYERIGFFISNETNKQIDDFFRNKDSYFNKKIEMSLEIENNYPLNIILNSSGTDGEIESQCVISDGAYFKGCISKSFKHAEFYKMFEVMFEQTKATFSHLS